MLRMTNHSDPSHLSDICLLLRAHAEQRWLNHEVVPVAARARAPRLAPRGAAGRRLAYLEVLWIEARQRAAETEAAHADLDAIDGAAERALAGKARGYHAAVRACAAASAVHVQSSWPSQRRQPRRDQQLS